MSKIKVIHAAPSLLLQRELNGSEDSIPSLTTYICGEAITKNIYKCVFCIQIYMLTLQSSIL